MRITVNHETCTGHGRCAAVAPEVYSLDDDGYNSMTESEVAPGLEAKAKLGADNCPERAIAVSD